MSMLTRSQFFDVQNLSSLEMFAGSRTFLGIVDCHNQTKFRKFAERIHME
jgi:hypothetical protein